MPQRLRSAPRQSFGFVYSPQVQNDVQQCVNTRRMATVQKNVFIQNGMEGTGAKGAGILENIQKAINIGQKASALATGEVGTAIRNLLPSSDKNARPGFAGEKHAILKLPNGRFGVANYMGPGTQIEKRLARGDPPRTRSDKVAQAHDIRYSLAKNQMDVSRADRKMVDKLKQLERTRGDSKFNTQIGMRLIQAKLALEKTGLAKPGQIASFGDIAESSRKPFKAKLSELEQEGYGLPADMLKAKLLKRTRTFKKSSTKALNPQGSRKKGKGERKRKGKGCKGKGCCGKCCTLDMIIDKKHKASKGSGLSLAGGVDMRKVVKFLSKVTTSKILPALLKMLSGGSLKLAGQGLPKKKLNTLIHMRMLKALNTGASKSKTLPGTKNYMVGAGGGIVKKLKPMAIATAKSLLPIIIKMAISKMRGGAESFEALKKRVENPSILGKLSNKLAVGLFQLFKKMIMGKHGQGGGSFASFFKGFKKGFMKVFKPALSVAKAVAPIVPLLL